MITILIDFEQLVYTLPAKNLFKGIGCIWNILSPSDRPIYFFCWTSQDSLPSLPEPPLTNVLFSFVAVICFVNSILLLLCFLLSCLFDIPCLMPQLWRTLQSFFWKVLYKQIFMYVLTSFVFRSAHPWWRLSQNTKLFCALNWRHNKVWFKQDYLAGLLKLCFLYQG